MIEKNFSVNGHADVEVRIESGRVEVKRGEPGTVAIEVDTKDTGFRVEQRGNSILVSSDKGLSWLSRSPAYVVIEMPEDSNLSVAVASAQTEVTVPLKRVDLKTASGDIFVDAADTLTIKTASGSARVGQVGTALRYASASGDLTVTGSCAGSVGISTASGDVHLADAPATLNVNTVSGGVDVTNFTGKSAKFKAMSGTVNLGIPAGTTVDLDANLLSGRLNLPEPDPNRGEPKRHVSIKASLVSGDLNIERT